MDAYPSDFISVELLPCVDGDGIGEGVSMNGGKYDILYLHVVALENWTVYSFFTNNDIICFYLRFIILKSNKN